MKVPVRFHESVPDTSTLFADQETRDFLASEGLLTRDGRGCNLRSFARVFRVASRLAGAAPVPSLANYVEARRIVGGQDKSVAHGVGM